MTQATNSLQSEVIFHCNAVLTDVIVPSSIDIDVKWLVDGKNVHSETFNAEERVSGVLTEEHWSMGQTVKMFIILHIYYHSTEMHTCQTVARKDNRMGR